MSPLHMDVGRNFSLTWKHFYYSVKREAVRADALLAKSHRSVKEIVITVRGCEGEVPIVQKNNDSGTQALRHFLVDGTNPPRI